MWDLVGGEKICRRPHDGPEWTIQGLSRPSPVPAKVSVATSQLSLPHGLLQRGVENLDIVVIRRPPITSALKIR